MKCILGMASERGDYATVLWAVGAIASVSDVLEVSSGE